MVLRPRPEAAGRATDTNVQSGPARLALLAVVVALAVACSGSQSGDGDPVEVDVAGDSVDASPEPESDPAGAHEATVEDSPDDKPDPASGDTAAAEASPVPDANGGAEASSDGAAQENGTAGAEDAGAEDVEAEDAEAEAAVAEGAEAEGDEAEGDEAEDAEAEDAEAEDAEAEDAEAEDAGAEDVEAEGSVAEAAVAEGAETPEIGQIMDMAVPETVRYGLRAPLTGEPTTDPTLAQRRALAVKVGNSGRRARPQAGLAAADIVYELLIEGGESRLVAVFHSEMPGRVGPVRSARTSDFDLLADLSRPYLASSGANATVLAEMRRADWAGTIVDVGGMRTFMPYSRDPARRPPYNLYLNTERLAGSDGAALRGGPLETPVAPLLDYGSSNPAGIAGANGVTVTYHRSTNNVVSHIWDAAAGGWVRIQDGDLMTTETGSGLREVAPVNVAVVWTTHRRAPSDAESPLTVSYGTGDALVLTAGAVHEAVWERSEDRAGFRFVDTAGNPLSLSPGSTWLLIANSSRRFPVTGAEVLADADGTRLLAEAREAAEAASVP